MMIHERVHMPLGLMYLHEYLTLKGVDVPPIVDLTGLPENKWNIPVDGDYYGFSVTTPQYPLAVKVAKMIKNNNIRAKTIIGGVHASLLAKDCLKDFDHVVSGEGEHALLDIVNGKTPVDRKPEKNLDTFPHPKLSSIDADSYTLKLTFAFQGNTVERDAGWMISSRGCPQYCTFCCSPFIWESKVRFHSIDYMTAWKKYWNDMGIDSFYFVDEQVATSKSRLYKICDMMEGGGYWKCQVRGDAMTPEKLNRMYKAGCRQIHLGSESGSQRILDLCKKNELVQDNENAINWAHDAGIGVKTSLMVGLPTETQEDVDLTIEFLKRANPEEVIVCIFVPYPGCEIYNNPKQFGYNLDVSKNWLDYVCIGTEELTTVMDKGKEKIVQDRKMQILESIGNKYILYAQKERWEKWRKY